MVTRKAIQSGIGKIEANAVAAARPFHYRFAKRGKGIGREADDVAAMAAVVAGDWRQCHGLPRRDTRLLSRIIARLVSRLREATS